MCESKILGTAELFELFIGADHKPEWIPENRLTEDVEKKFNIRGTFARSADLLPMECNLHVPSCLEFAYK